MCGKDVANVSTVEDVLKSGQNANPYRGSPVTWNEPACIEKGQPGRYRKKRKCELASGRKNEGDEDQSRDSSLE